MMSPHKKKLKMYYIANARMPTERAHGIQLAKMCEAFIEEGIDLELVAPGRRTSTQTVQDFYGLRVGIPVKKLPVIDWYSFGRWGFIIGSCSFILSYFFYFLWKRIRGERGIIYTTDIDQFSFFLIPFLGMPYVVEMHDAKKKNFRFSFFLSRACGIVAINSIIKQALCEVFGLDMKRIVVHPNGIDRESFRAFPTKFEARSTLGLPQESVIALYVGKFYAWKGMEVLCDAAALSQDILFFLVGGTIQEFETTTGRRDVPSNIIAVGQRDFKEIPKWLAAADVTVLLGTKQNDYSFLHTSPMKLFEYMAAGKPIIASNTPANREIISEQEAYFYEPDNASDLAAKIQYVSRNPEEARIKTIQAADKVMCFSWQRRTEEILEFIYSCGYAL